MLEQVGYFIGMAVADVVHFFRGRQAVPCLVDWELVAEMERVAALYAADDCCRSCDNGCWSDDPTA